MSEIRKHLHKPKLGTQLLSLGTLLIIVMTTLYAGLNIRSQNHALDRFYSNQATSLSQNLAISSSALVLERRFDQMENLLLKIGTFDKVLSATLCDTQLKVLARAVRPASGAPMRLDYNLESMVKTLGSTPIDIPYITEQSGGNSLLVIQPVVAGEKIGAVVVEYDLKEKGEQINQITQGNIILTTLVALGLFMVLLIYTRSKNQELLALTDFAQRMVKEDPTMAGAVQIPNTRELADLHDSMYWASKQLRTRNEELASARLKAEKSNELKSTFLANMSHEIRTPLNGILGLTEIILGHHNLDRGTRENLEMIDISAQNLLRVVNDILDFSKIEANKLDIDIHDFNLRKLVSSIVRNLSGTRQKPDLEIQVELAENLPEQLHGDSGRIGQVLANLLSNSIKFTPRGIVKLSVSCSINQAAQTCTMLFKVTDTGIGISTESQQRIFEAFAQAEPGTTRKFGGTGLGLSITQRLLAMMDSKLILFSELGKGSCFSFELTLGIGSPTLPVSHSVVEEPNLQDHIDMQHSNEPLCSGIVATPALRVLVAEDNLVNQTFISHVLLQMGVACKIAEDGLVALQELQKSKFDLIFMDMQMPNMGGLEATELILQQEDLKDSVIVGLTADAILDTREACLKVGMKDYISKPFKRTDIEGVVSRLGFRFSHVPMQNFDNDKELLQTTLELIQGELQSQIANIEGYRDSQQWPHLRRTIHTIKGHAKLIGDASLAEMLQRVEDQVAKGENLGDEVVACIRNNLDVFNERLNALIGR